MDVHISFLLKIMSSVVQTFIHTIPGPECGLKMKSR